jgi:hypothetical protein
MLFPRHGGRRRARRRLRAWTLALLCAAARAQDRVPVWTDSELDRARAQALVATLETDLLASPTATAALERWCGEHLPASEAKVVVLRLDGPEVAATPEQRARLGADPREPIAFRRVELRCGSYVLSQAENWFLPERLPAAMREALATTDTPFGKVIRPLAPYRRTIEARRLWDPAAADRSVATPATPNASTDCSHARFAATDAAADVACSAPVALAAAAKGPLEIPDALFEQRALVYAGDGHAALAEVHEIYRRGLLDLALAPRVPALVAR